MHGIIIDPEKSSFTSFPMNSSPFSIFWFDSMPILLIYLKIEHGIQENIIQFDFFINETKQAAATFNRKCRK